MAETPDFLTLKRNRDRPGVYEVPIRRAARLQNIASLGQVKWAVLETSGQISFIKQG